ncbi:MAG: MOSC domain-containing protein [Alphaproteobacteria bacterium]|nr:MOSC domain-containing protein [Alphaproteobacteria bacterium]
MSKATAYVIVPIGNRRAATSRWVRAEEYGVSINGSGRHEWPGSGAMIGPVAMDFIDPTPRCVMTTLPQADLAKDTAIFRTAAAWIKAPSITFAPGEMMSVIAGVHATATTAGVISVGDMLRPW